MKKANFKTNRTKLYHRLINNKLVYDNKSLNRYKKDIGQNLYHETAASGTPELVVPGRDGAGNVKQRALEFSNVNIIEEMMNMLLTERSFQIVVGAINSIGDLIKASMDVPK